MGDFTAVVIERAINLRAHRQIADVVRLLAFRMNQGGRRN